MELHWNDVALVGFSAAATLIALFAAFVSYTVYRSQSDPEVVVYAEGDKKRPSLINLIIKNIGKGGALDVTFALSSDIPSKAFGLDVATAQHATKMTDGPLVRGIPFLPPGGSRIITWGQYGGLVKALGEGTVLVTAEYESHHFGIRRRIKHKTTCPLDIVSFAGTDASDENYDKQIAKNIEELTKAVRDVGKGMSGTR